MTHDDFVKALADAEGWAAGGPHLPPEAAAHARACAECGQLLAGLVALGGADTAGTVTEESDDADFHARLEARIKAARQTPQARARGASTTWLRLAAALLAGLALLAAWRVLRGGHARQQAVNAPAGAGATAQPSLPQALAAATPDELDAALAAFAAMGLEPEGWDESGTTLPMLEAAPVLADGLDEALDPSGGAGPVETLADELASGLSADEQRELARRLREAA